MNQTTDLNMLKLRTGVFSLSICLAVLWSLPGVALGQGDVTVTRYRVVALSTNFILPFARFNFTEADNKKEVGHLSLFKSVGAGFTLNYGRMTTTVEEGSQNEDLDRKFYNAIGLNFGVLFSADLSAEQPTNVFAPTIGLSLMDFAIGWGYELGTHTDGETGHFLTISYDIPLQKLSSKGTWPLWKKELEADQLMLR